jgi:hypothetical protein
VRSMQRLTLTALMIGLAASASGCAVKWNREGLCFKPLFRVRVELNRANGDDDVRVHGVGHHGDDCDCHDGGLIDGGIIDGGVIPGGFVPHGAVTVETQPLGLPILPGGDGALLAENFLSAAPPTVAQTASTPAFGPGFNQAATAPPASSSGTGTQQTAKKRPGALTVSTGVDLSRLDGARNAVLRVGDKDIVFGVYVENSGDMPIDVTQLQGVFTNNLRPVKVERFAGATRENLQRSTTSARIEGQKVVFDRYTQLGPETKYEYQITVEVAAAGAGNFEVTEIAGPAVKKNTPTTAQ